MTRNRAISGKSCPTQKAENGHKKHDFSDAASPNIRPERESRAAERREELAPPCRKISRDMRPCPQQQRTPGATQALRPHHTIQNGRSHEQHQAGMRQAAMAKSFSQKTGKEFQPATEHGAFGINVGQKAAQQSRTDGERFRRQHVPAHRAEHGEAANQQMGTSGHAPLWSASRRLANHLFTKRSRMPQHSAGSRETL